MALHCLLISWILTWNGFITSSFHCKFENNLLLPILGLYFNLCEFENKMIFINFMNSDFMVSSKVKIVKNSQLFDF